MACFQIIGCNWNGKFRLIACSTKADTRDTIHDGWVRKTFRHNCPVFRQRYIRYWSNSRYDFIVFQSVQKWSDNFVFQCLMHITDAKKGGGITQRCVPPIQNTNLLEFIWAD